MKRILALLLFISMTSAHAGESEIRQSLQTRFPNLGKIDHIAKTAYLGLYEVAIDGQLYYVDEKARYLFEGNIIELSSKSNVTEARKRVLFAIDFDKLPLDIAVKRVKGNGSRKMAYFTDPNCSFCQRLEKELSTVTDATLYIFMFPIFPGSDEIVRNVRCASDPIKAWDDWMLTKIKPANATCTPPTDEILKLGRKLHVNGTPNLIFANGTQSPGFLPAEELEKNLNQPRGK